MKKTLDTNSRIVDTPASEAASPSIKFVPVVGIIGLAASLSGCGFVRAAGGPDDWDGGRSMNMPIPKSEPEALDALAADIAKVQPPQIDADARNAATINASGTSAAHRKYAKDFLCGAWGSTYDPNSSSASWQIDAFILGRNDGLRFAGNRSDSYKPVEQEDPEPFDEFTGPCPDDDEQAAIPDGYRVLPDSGGAGRWATWAIVLGAAAILGWILWKFSNGGAN